VGHAARRLALVEQDMEQQLEINVNMAEKG
jgi:hypothetical protein